jgi:hypothetical protein
MLEEAEKALLETSVLAYFVSSSEANKIVLEG